eukprot:CAMPEP_0174724118 /NCGR_PEP_ID=MMETSP1094-20130205/42633_1 /TAXON_ID=156173 /ORGANISM="Chrysochromulina brevifilum, Strain UTEX LB 985" /LENGTH=481 /DNA_ID=CAMNT_0015925285 /DNA_START=43 /DNA_END=1484 /DNA_ORIENTATION=-
MSADLRFPGRYEMLGTLASAQKINIDQLMFRLKADVFKSRLRLREFFRDFDPLRTGICTVAKFRTAVDESGLKLTDPEFTTLSTHFADPTDPKRMRYDDFLNQLDTVFNTAGMEADPASTVSDFTPHLARPDATLSISEEAACDELLAKLQHIVKVRQLLIKPTFSDYSKNVNSTLLVDQITKAQFRNGLSQLGLQLTAEEANLLTTRFASSPGYVDYVAFCCAVDPMERTFSMREPRSYVEQPLKSGFRSLVYHPDVHEPSQPGRAPVTNNNPKLPVDYPTNPQLESLLTKLRQKASQHRLRPTDFFIEFDKHCDGTVTQPQFIKRLSVAYDKMGLGLSEDEIGLLLETYGKKMRHGAVHVEWRKFVGDIDKVFTTVNMEKDPYLAPTYSTNSQVPVTLTPHEREAAVQGLIADLRKRVEVRRVLVKPLFNDFGDWSHSTKIIDHITRQQMCQALSRFGIELTANEQQLLYDRYDTLGFG